MTIDWAVSKTKVDPQIQACRVTAERAARVTANPVTRERKSVSNRKIIFPTARHSKNLQKAPLSSKRHLLDRSQQIKLCK